MKQSVTTFDEFVKNAFTSRNFFDYKKGPEPFFSPECQKAIMDHYIAETCFDDTFKCSECHMPASWKHGHREGGPCKWAACAGHYQADPPIAGVGKGQLGFGDYRAKIGGNAIVPAPAASQGAVCTKCNGRNEYAEPSASYICYECR